jgi:pilus assembly protein FimV
LLLFVGKAWALGLGDIRLESALGEPLRAEIEVISAAPGELESLFVQLATAETFERYGLDRPRFLADIRFDVQSRNGRNFVTVTTASPVVEPFVTILIEASWPQGRILREYTMLIDPPTFTPPEAVKPAPQVTAPRQTAEADRGVIERPAPRPSTPAPRETAPAPRDTAPAPAEQRPAERPQEQTRAADSAGGQVYRVAPSETLWGIARDMRPEEGLSINQTMLAIFEANPQAFDGNINRLRAGAYLTIPTADDIYRISRGDATAEVQRQNEAWRGGTATVSRRPSLSLVPPDEPVAEADDAAYDDYTPPASAAVPDTDLQDRVRDLEEQIADQDALIEVRDNEIARLREQLERLQQEQETAADVEAPADGAAGVDLEGKAEPEPQPVPAQPRPVEEPGLFGSILDFLTGFWGAVIGGLVILALVMVWFARRAVMTAGGDDDAFEDSAAEMRAPLGDTARIEPMSDDDDAFVVVEGERDETWPEDAADTMEVPAAKLSQTTRFEPGETLSTETGVNLDAEDPIAEADFHLAYGLYDQAAELISNALAKDEDRKDLMAKLCEIYFVWGNKDEFVRSAERLHAAMGDHLGSDWDKVAIMGQQIAPDSELFSVGASLASSSVDLAFDDEEADSGLDIDLEDDSGDGDTQIMDLGESGDDVDFVFDDADADASADDETIESPAEEQTEHMKVLQASSPAQDEAADIHRPDDTAEIDLDDLGLDLEGLAESGIREGIGEEDVDIDLAEVDDQMAKTDFQIGKLEDAESGSDADEDEDTRADFLDLDLSSGDDAANESDEPGADGVDIEITGINEALLADDDATAADLADDDSDEVFDIGEDFDEESDAETEVLQEGDETELLPEDLGVALDSSLLDATSETAAIDEDEIGEDESTVLADGSLAHDADQTRQLPVADKGEEAQDLAADDLDDLDLELDDLTAALKVGDIAEDLADFDDLTTEQPAADLDKLASGGDETLDLDGQYF